MATAKEKAAVPVKTDVWTEVATIAGSNVEDFTKSVLAATNFKPDNKDQLLGFLSICAAHKLNPLTKEIFAFVSGGRVMPIVSIDGWAKLVNSSPQFDGVTTDYVFAENGDLLACTCTMYRKDRSHPTTVTELLSECTRGTPMWKQWPARMLRHKAFIQCARYAFSFADMYEADEAERITGESVWENVEGSYKDVTPPPPPPPLDEQSPIERQEDVQDVQDANEPPPMTEEPETQSMPEGFDFDGDETKPAEPFFSLKDFETDMAPCKTMDDLKEVLASYAYVLTPETSYPADMAKARQLYAKKAEQIKGY